MAPCSVWGKVGMPVWLPALSEAEPCGCGESKNAGCTESVGTLIRSNGEVSPSGSHSNESSTCSPLLEDLYFGAPDYHVVMPSVPVEGWLSELSSCLPERCPSDDSGHGPVSSIDTYGDVAVFDGSHCP